MQSTSFAPMLFVATLAAFVAPSIYAQSLPVPPAVVEAARPPTSANEPAPAHVEPCKKSDVPLWRVTSGKAVVYILGSIHAANADVYPLDTRIQNVFHAADTLVTEIDMSPVGREQMSRLLAVYGLYPAEDSLDRHLDKATLGDVEKAVAQAGGDMDKFLRMRPWYAALALNSVALSQAGMQWQWGVDEHLCSIAGRKKAAALETMIDQASVFRDLADETSVALLRLALKELDGTGTLLRESLEAWKCGDGAKMEELIVKPLRDMDATLYSRLLPDRNRKMTEGIERYLGGDGTIFVVVGAAHLYGNDSVLEMLRQRGHVVEKI